eukprot:GHUV01046662.1.p1 GENE.GHUV01046662.1~~GHUV01046662.1.p1  ORF type:complete len:144 (-),score=37.11 GHUV01046662.1:191-622(-)
MELECHMLHASSSLCFIQLSFLMAEGNMRNGTQAATCIAASGRNMVPCGTVSTAVPGMLVNRAVNASNIVLLLLASAVQLTYPWLANRFLAGGADSEKLMQDLIKSAQRPVAAGKVRRKKADAAAKRAAPLNKSKGFASASTR